MVSHHSNGALIASSTKTCNGGCSTKLQQNRNMLGWRVPSLPGITLKESFLPPSTNWSRGTVDLPSTSLFTGQEHFGLGSLPNTTSGLKHPQGPQHI